MAPPAAGAQTLEQLYAGQNERRRPAAWEAPTSRIIDSQAHTWVKIPNTWRHHARRTAGAAQPAISPILSYQPSRPAPDGSFVMSEDASILALSCVQTTRSRKWSPARRQNSLVSRDTANTCRPSQARRKKSWRWTTWSMACATLGCAASAGVSSELWWPLPPRASSRSSTRSSRSAGHIRRRSSFMPTRRRCQKHRLLQSGAVRAGDPSTSDAKSHGRRTEGFVRRGDEDGSAL
jgi:hypothetical protein